MAQIVQRALSIACPSFLSKTFISKQANLRTDQRANGAAMGRTSQPTYLPMGTLLDTACSELQRFYVKNTELTLFASADFANG